MKTSFRGKETPVVKCKCFNKKDLLERCFTISFALSFSFSRESLIIIRKLPLRQPGSGLPSQTSSVNFHKISFSTNDTESRKLKLLGNFVSAMASEPYFTSFFIPASPCTYYMPSSTLSSEQTDPCPLTNKQAKCSMSDNQSTFEKTGT